MKSKSLNVPVLWTIVKIWLQRKRCLRINRQRVILILFPMDSMMKMLLIRFKKRSKARKQQRKKRRMPRRRPRKSSRRMKLKRRQKSNRRNSMRKIIQLPQISLKIQRRPLKTIKFKRQRKKWNHNRK